MKNIPLDFQTATADHVLEAYRKGQKRVLVADEAGLGKTTVASEVVRRLRDELSHGRHEDNKTYCIVYVCCNLQIAQQNIDSLSDEGVKVDLSQSRLSMQHYVYYKKLAELKQQKKDTLVLSLTPATSFQMTWRTGSANERALMYACIRLLPEFQGQHDKLSSMFMCRAPKVWPDVRDYYYDDIHDNMKVYQEIIIKSMRSHLQQKTSTGDTYLNRLRRLVNAVHDEKWRKDCDYFIIKLRRMFANISLEIMKPDLVIMDEFQKFSSLIDTDKKAETEENMIARKFFANPDTYFLLLSATPYKPYTTLEELNDSNDDEQYRDFHRLMDFLHFSGPKVVDSRTIWHDYSMALKHLDKETRESLEKKHNEAEEMLYFVMGRTERANEGIIKEIIPSLEPYFSAGDIKSFVQMQHLIDKCRKLGQTVYSAPVDYSKSTAFQLSFMDNYKLKDKISNAWKDGAGKGIAKDCLLLDKEAIEDYTLDKYQNAKLAYVIDTIFGKGKNKTNAESLLWVPASHPYYTQQSNVFTKNASFSKFLIFSSWGMVPKMLACLISYEAERRLLLSRKKNTYHGNDAQLLRDSNKTKSLSVMFTVSTYLADLYKPEDFYGKPLGLIKDFIVKKVRIKLCNFRINRVSRVSSLDIYQLILALDDPNVQPRNIPQNAEEILADMAIGSPAICIYRIFRRLSNDDKQTRQYAEEVAREIASLFNSRTGIAAVHNNCKSYNNYFQNVIDYCIKGNLQAVLDEFVHMIGENKSIDKIAGRMKESFIPANIQQVNTIQTFGTEMKYKMRKHFAMDFGSGKQTEKDVKHTSNLRSAFNSPFRPFVLASTSIGQEGLDFHWYCRKIIHWNLPSNPQNLEQREGRINRYKCLSVRRNIAKLYNTIFSWNEMFKNASEELKGNNSEMVPFWFLPLDDKHFKEIATEKIERIVPMYPLSEDISKYHRLIKVLSLYRLTMGQPRQEELLQMLEDKVAPEQLKQLLFDLCPFSRIQKNSADKSSSSIDR